VLSGALAVSANAQMPLSPAEAAEVNCVLDHEPPSERLGCKIEREDPSLDFEFRFTAGFTVQCPLKVFEGRKSSVNMFVRVTPEGGAPVLLSGTRKLAGVPTEMADFTDRRTLSTLLEFSGASGTSTACDRTASRPSRRAVILISWKNSPMSWGFI
jgi:hypothetical protein